MKLKAIKHAVLLFAAIFTCSYAAASEVNNDSQGTCYILSTGANGEIISVQSESSKGDACWHIRDLSGTTNIRNKPNGKVCMRLKAWTQYSIYTKGGSDGWLRISSIYNERENYWVRLHSSSTGTYWIAASILY